MARGNQQTAVKKVVPAAAAVPLPKKTKTTATSRKSSPKVKKSPAAVTAAVKKDNRKQAPVAAPNAVTGEPIIPEPMDYRDLDSDFIKREVVMNERTIIVKYDKKELIIANPATALFGCVFCPHAGGCFDGTHKCIQLSGIANHFKPVHKNHNGLSTKHNKNEWVNLVQYKAPHDSDEFKDLKALKKSLFEGSFPVVKGKGVPKAKITKDSIVVSKRDYEELCERSGLSVFPVDNDDPGSGDPGDPDIIESLQEAVDADKKLPGLVPKKRTLDRRV